MKKLLVVVALAAALLTLAAVGAGWKWGHSTLAMSQSPDSSQVYQGWTWEGSDLT